MAEFIRSNDPIVIKFGKVEQFEVTSGGPNSENFQFYLDGTSFQLRPDMPSHMFAAMSSIISNSYSSGKAIAVSSFDRLPSGVYLVNTIRDRELTQKT
jgi:hypothetical protein